mmetsp:Transcript_64/g.64  ORF Transcript_64/g.64 Transcript_64/m.64 type:complete len:96 (-) Transcript_64:185-472(-)
MMAGGHSAVHEVTNEDDPIYADAISERVLEALGVDSVIVVSYTRQVVAGTRYQLKLQVGEEYWHCDVVKPLPHTGETAFLMDGTLQTGKNLEDPF